MINDIDFLYGFIYECTNLINNICNYDNYDHLVIKLCSEFVMPIINITKKEHIKDTISALEHNKDIFSICSYLMNICCERYFKLSHDEYLEIKEFIDIIESKLAPINDYFDLYKKCYGQYYCSCYYYHKKKVKHIFPRNRHTEFHEKVIYYIKFFYLLQKNIKLNKNIYNISVLIDVFINLYDNKKIEINYMICIIISFLINSFIVIIINRSFYY